MLAQVSASMFRPSRLNFAQVCIWCGTWRCQASACVARHEVSWWAPCDSCWAGAEDEPGDCYCVAGGLIEMASREQAERRAEEFFAFLGVSPVVALRAVAA
jgi:hypothetical protein